MRIPVAGLVGVVLVLSLTASAWADIPPPPPAGLKDAPGLQPLPIALAGLAAALAVAVAGVGAARSRGRPAVRTAALVAAAAILATAAVFAFRAARAWEEQAALKAEYEKSLANWHPRGPVPPPRAFREAPPALAVFALAPQNSFPHSLPWAAFVLNGPTHPRGFRERPAPSDAKTDVPGSSANTAASTEHP
jgi:hypothetical protein